jgi:hypothetical protein
MDIEDATEKATSRDGDIKSLELLWKMHELLWQLAKELARAEWKPDDVGGRLLTILDGTHTDLVDLQPKESQ